MSNKFLKKVRIGWDIGGAHIKYCVESDFSKNIWYDLIEFEFWNCYKRLSHIIRDINHIYHKKNIRIENYFTMSAEMCDCFDDRSVGVKYIIEQIVDSGCESYIFTRNGFIKSDKISTHDFKNIASHNWYASAIYISKKYKNAIAVDFGSTTCDFLIIKNGKIINKRTSDFSGLQTRELLYTGCARTPIYSHLNEVILDNKKFKIIPEQFSSMSDIYIILNKIKPNEIYSKVLDGTDNTKINACKRVSRSFGFDFTKGKLSLIHNLSEKIYNNQIKLIENAIRYHINRYFKDMPNIDIIGLGLGHNSVSYICKKNKLKYENICKVLETEIDNGSSITKLFSSFVMCRIPI